MAEVDGAEAAGPQGAPHLVAAEGGGTEMFAAAGGSSMNSMPSWLPFSKLSAVSGRGEPAALAGAGAAGALAEAGWSFLNHT